MDGSEADRLPIVQYWHDGEPPDYIAELLESFAAHNPGVPHLVFDAAAAERFIADRFGERELAAFRACAVPAMQADYFRYCAGLAMGGFYCDADVRCVASLEDFMPTAGEGWLLRRPHEAIVNGLFAFGSAGHPLLELTVELVTLNIEARSWKSVYQATGPAVWTTLHWIVRMGSFEAAAAKAPDVTWERYVGCCRTAAGSHERLARAFAGVRLTTLAELDPLLKATPMRFPYKAGESHWANVKGSIYATSSSGAG